MRLTEEQIKEINAKQPDWDMGIYNEPYKIPTNVKGLVLYQRYISGGMTGGNCWDERSYRFDNDEPEFTILNDVLAVIKPDITFKEREKLSYLIQDDGYTDIDYYGNYDDYEIRYLVLEELYKKLNL